MFLLKSFFKKPTSHSIFMLDVLGNLKKKYVPLTISFPSSNDYYASALIKINPDSDVLFLDEVSNKTGHHKVLSGIPFWVNAKLEGVCVSFQTQVTNPSMSKYGYRVEFPNYFNYQERRKSKRHVVQDKPIKAIVMCQDGKMLSGEVVDISTDGVQIKLPNNLTNLFENLSLLPNCMLYLDESDTIDCDLALLRNEYKSKTACTHIAAMFSRISNYNKCMIEYFIEKRESIAP